MKRAAFTIMFLWMMQALFAQVEPVLENGRRPTRTTRSATQRNTNAVKKTDAKDSTIGFEHRDDLKDSITIGYRFLDSTRRNTIDSSVNNFDNYFSVPSSWQYLGNNGAAAFPLVFEPFVKPGWDAGFHAFDIYRYTLEASRFYKTTKPFSMLSYQIASGKEQMLKAMHTQNPKPNLNVGFDYRLITSPGLFITQNTNHNNFRIFSNYQGKRKRYNAYMVFVGNTIRASQNGGIQNDSFLLDPNRKDRFSVPVNFGNGSPYNNNPFVTTVSTGNTYKDASFFFRQSYDVGKKDSVAINDSTTEFLFYPKLRIQYSLTASTYKYQFADIVPDSGIYKSWYGITLPGTADSFYRSEKWNVTNHDFSLVQFPDTKNTAQFFLAGATWQNIHGRLRTGELINHNIILHGEYRNRTRNKLWDVLLNGEYYVNGFNSGDYNAHASLSRYLNRRFGNVNLFFNNVNRTASFIFDNRSSFNLDNNNVNNFKKENITSFGATASNPYFTLGFKNHLLTNYSYFYDYYHSTQYGKLINVLQVAASKTIKLRRQINWYAEATLQQTDAASPIKLPLVFTRSRFAYEGRFYKNLNLSAGVEIRYYTPYKAPNYSPILGQFTPQDTTIVKNLPDVSAFIHFRIRGFTGFIRGENLNTASLENGFGFVNNNFAALHYPTQGLIIRFGIQWWFVN